MTSGEFNKIAKGLKAVYTKPEFIPDNFAMEVWYRALADIPYELASAAVQQYIATQHFEPKPADIREIAASIVGKKEELTVAEAFSLYWDALCDSGYNAEARFAALPEIVQRVAGSPSAMHDAAISADTNQSVERALFEKRFRVEQEREKEDAKIPAHVRDMIAKMQESNLLEIAG